MTHGRVHDRPIARATQLRDVAFREVCPLCASVVREKAIGFTPTGWMYQLDAGPYRASAALFWIGGSGHALCIAGLFYAMLLGVSDGCLFRMSSGVNGVRSSGVSVVGSLLMMARVVMLSRFPMMPGSVCVVL
jgi:hypothetical protein